jgi:hypothetical protein
MNFELNFNSTKFNSTIKLKIQLKKNEMQIGGKDIVNMFVNMMLKQKPSK